MKFKDIYSKATVDILFNTIIFENFVSFLWKYCSLKISLLLYKNIYRLKVNIERFVLILLQTKRRIKK